MWLIWQIGVSTGLRISDILALKVGQILRKQFYITEIKTKKKKHVYIRQYVVFEFSKYVRKNKLTKKDKAFNISRQTVWRNIKKAAAECGIKKAVGTHSMRHTYAKRNIKKYGLRELQRRMNHERITDTLLYTLGNEEIE